MDSVGDTRPPGRSPAVLRLAGWLTVGVSMVVLVGWLTGISALTSIVPGQIAMKFNTALTFLLFGIGAVLLGTPVNPGARRVGYGLFVVGAAVAAAIGLQYVTGTDFGIDQLLIREPEGAVNTVHLGRMSPQTVVALIAIAAAAVLARLPRLATPMVLLTAGTAFVLGAMNLLDFVYGANAPTFLRQYTQMALPTAALITALSAAVIELLPAGGPITAVQTGSPSARILRPMLAVAFIVPIVVGWLRLQGERIGLYESAFGVGIMTLATTGLFLVATWMVATRMKSADERREAAEGRLARALAETSDLYDNAPVGYHSLDAQGVFVRMNETELTWLGYARDQVVGRMRFTDLLTPASTEIFHANFRQFRERGWIRDVEFDMVRADGSVMPVVLSATAIHDAQGKFLMSRSVVYDISDRRRVEEERERAKRDAQEANLAKSEFLSRMSHELRTPLNSVIGFAQLLEMDELTAEQREHVKYIARAGRHLLDLINEVLDISRIESGTMTMSLEPVRLSEVVDEVAAMVRPMAEAQAVSLAPLEGGTADVFVLADRQRLRQVLLNLLSNAIKYNRAGGSISVAVGQEQDRVRIDVSDTGQGMSAEHLDRLFTPFDRLGAERTEVEGTGMGLALSRALVAAMQGTLDVRSEVGVGTTFSVGLAVAQPPAGALDETETGHESASGLAERTVLYVEDNLANLRLVERILERVPNVRLLTAMKGSLGLELAREHRPDLVLLDLHLPDMTGLDVLRALRGEPITAATHVVMLTADETSWRPRQLLEEGALAYLTKPLDIPRFLEVLELTLGVRDHTGAS